MIARNFQRAQDIEQAKGAVNMLKDKGMVVTVLPQPVIEKFSANIGADFVKGFYAEVGKARKSAK